MGENWKVEICSELRARGSSRLLDLAHQGLQVGSGVGDQVAKGVQLTGIDSGHSALHHFKISRVVVLLVLACVHQAFPELEDVITGLLRCGEVYDQVLR